jgi:hypothetical protein
LAPKPAPPPPEFFVDRSLGRRIIPEGLRALGLVVHAMADVYPNDLDETVTDEQWIADADAANWVALTKDERITRYAAEQDALTRSRLRVFAIGNQHLTGAVMLDYFVTNINRIIQRSRKDGPYVDVVLKGGVERRWPRVPR